MIELRDVSFRAGGRNILNGINLSVVAGESVAVVGESGAGKSTLGKILLGILSPTDGTYLFQGTDVAKLRGAARRAWRMSIQAVFQNPTASLNPRLSIEMAVAEPLLVRGQLSRTERGLAAEELLTRVGLSPESRFKFPHQLSGGQKQRVLIARALSVESPALLLDEPGSALDVSARAQVLNLLRDLRESGSLTMVYITHDLATVGYLCERVAVLYQGEIVEQCTVRQLRQAPSHPYTQALVSAVTNPTSPRKDKQ